MHIKNIKQDIRANDFLFYDIEVFKYDSIIVFKDLDKNIVKVFHNDFRGLMGYVKGEILVGYNNYGYDDWILTTMLNPSVQQSKIKKTNDLCIQSNERPGQIDDEIFSLDCMQEIKPKDFIGLKRIEANMGKSIVETPISFDLDRPLSEDELTEVIAYCSYDVDSTIDIFKIRWNRYFAPKLNLALRLPAWAQGFGYRWNTTKISQYVLKPNKTKNVRKYVFPEVQNLDRKYPFIPKEVIQTWNDKSQIALDLLDCKITFSQGGLHGVTNRPVSEFRDVKLLDVTSMYPNIIRKIGVLNPDVLKRYESILQERVKVKHSDKVLSDALKLVLNSVSGLLVPEYSLIKNPEGATAMRLLGQVWIFDLATRLFDSGCSIIQLNTDGVAFQTDNEEYKDVWHEWEEDYGVSLELDEFEKFFQKDVNNYIAQRRNGSLKIKGGMVNSYFDPVSFEEIDPDTFNPGTSWNSKNSCGIIAHCIVDNLLYGKSVAETIHENLDNPILFQFVLDRGNKRDGVIDKDGNTDYQRYNRVFACNGKNGYTHLQMYKDNVDEDGNPIKQTFLFPDTPKKMFLFNGDLKNFDNFKEIIDIQYYIDLAESKLNMWTKVGVV